MNIEQLKQILVQLIDAFGTKCVQSYKCTETGIDRYVHGFHPDAETDNWSIDCFDHAKAVKQFAEEYIAGKAMFEFKTTWNDRIAELVKWATSVAYCHDDRTEEPITFFDKAGNVVRMFGGNEHDYKYCQQELARQLAEKNKPTEMLHGKPIKRDARGLMIKPEMFGAKSDNQIAKEHQWEREIDRAIEAGAVSIHWVPSAPNKVRACFLNIQSYTEGKIEHISTVNEQGIIEAIFNKKLASKTKQPTWTRDELTRLIRDAIEWGAIDVVEGMHGELFFIDYSFRSFSREIKDYTPADEKFVREEFARQLAEKTKSELVLQKNADYQLFNNGELHQVKDSGDLIYVANIADYKHVVLRVTTTVALPDGFECGRKFVLADEDTVYSSDDTFSGKPLELMTDVPEGYVRVTYTSGETVIRPSPELMQKLINEGQLIHADKTPAPNNLLLDPQIPSTMDYRKHAWVGNSRGDTDVLELSDFYNND